MTATMDDLEQLARVLVDAHARRQPFTTLSVGGRRLSVDEGYAVQERLVRQLQGGTAVTVVGYKIGLTSAVMQQMCGIATPIHGAILSSRVHAAGCVLQRSDYGRLGLEFEIAVRLSRDVATPPASVQEMAASIDAVCAAIELVDDRSADYQSLDAASLVADNSWNAGVVLGRWMSPPDDLAGRAGRVSVDGVPGDAGRVGDALDHPFESVRWLATQLARTGRTLRAGMIIMTGSIVKTRFPSGPGAWLYEVDGMGAVAVEVR
ncbi:MAG TPA: fumarylacetoacetate hydrolase family protein [Ramlibacter sp.]